MFFCSPRLESLVKLVRLLRWFQPWNKVRVSDVWESGSLMDSGEAHVFFLNIWGPVPAGGLVPLASQDGKGNQTGRRFHFGFPFDK